MLLYSTFTRLLITCLIFSSASGLAAKEEDLKRSKPIDDSLFVASGSDLRSLTVERKMSASPQQIWDAWTSEAGWKATYAAGRLEVRANIELAVGGSYEWLFDGETGSNGCQILSYLPPRMLSFSWNAPVAQPFSRAKRTWMVIEIEPGNDGQSLVRATQLGFGTEPHWDETYDYFQGAWAYVLDTMAQSFEDP
ncbi:MAG TPA: SRPBCC domain-containing protein [Xanthomonadales bacterium]|nr:SRPBCC domain-containing protein [Xanthomonadales bacterium]